MNKLVWVLLVGVVLLGGCRKAPIVKDSLFSVGLKTYKGQYLKFSYPSSAKMHLVSTTESFLLGPQMIVGAGLVASSNTANVQGESKYAYQIHIQVHDNPMKLTSDVWAKNYIIQEWKHTQGGPSIYPVTQAGHIMEDFMSFVQVGREKAFMVDIFGYDYTTRSLFIAKDKIVIEMSFILFSEDNDSMAIMQKDVYALILGSLSLVGE